ncbi:MAG: TetR/AcrR family transcriptional regulator [Pseudomonadota bacterium]
MIRKKHSKRWASEAHWRIEGKQGRSQRTQTAILDATEQLLMEKGTDGTSVAEIAEVAGCSVGSVYHHFADKTAIFYALFDRTTSEFDSFIDSALASERWEGATIRDILGGFISLSQKSRKDRPEFKAAVYLIASEHPNLRKHYFELQQRLYKGLLDLMLERRDTIGHSNPERAASFVLDQLGAVLRVNRDQAQKSAQLSSLSNKDFKEETLRSAAAYLELKE